jgi:hypothetical protein
VQFETSARERGCTYQPSGGDKITVFAVSTRIAQQTNPEKWLAIFMANRSLAFAASIQSLENSPAHGPWKLVTRSEKPENVQKISAAPPARNHFRLSSPPLKWRAIFVGSERNHRLTF